DAVGGEQFSAVSDARRCEPSRRTVEAGRVRLDKQGIEVRYGEHHKRNREEQARPARAPPCEADQSDRYCCRDREHGLRNLMTETGVLGRDEARTYGKWPDRLFVDRRRETGECGCGKYSQKTKPGLHGYAAYESPPSLRRLRCQQSWSQAV